MAHGFGTSKPSRGDTFPPARLPWIPSPTGDRVFAQLSLWSFRPPPLPLSFAGSCHTFLFCGQIAVTLRMAAVRTVHPRLNVQRAKSSSCFSVGFQSLGPKDLPCFKALHCFLAVPQNSSSKNMQSIIHGVSWATATSSFRMCSSSHVTLHIH